MQQVKNYHMNFLIRVAKTSAQVCNCQVDTEDLDPCPSHQKGKSALSLENSDTMYCIFVK